MHSESRRKTGKCGHCFIMHWKVHALKCIQRKSGLHLHTNLFFNKVSSYSFSPFSFSILMHMSMLFNDRVTRTKCLFWSHTPSIQESFSLRGMMGIALCGTWPEESKSAPISTWWVSWLRLCLFFHRLCLSLHWSWNWKDPDICFPQMWSRC